MSMLTPPAADEAPLQLVAPEPVAPVKEESAASMLPEITPAEQQVIRVTADQFLKSVTTINPHSPEFVNKLAEVQTLGQAELVRASVGSSSILERKSSSVAGSKARGGDATTRVAGTLAELRNTMEDLAPTPENLTGVQKILGFIPGGKKIRRYFQRYETAQTQLDAIVKSLLAGQDELMKDNAALNQEKQSLWDTMGQLKQYIELAKTMDEEITAEIAKQRAAGNMQAAQTLEGDLLFAVRQRQQDLLTQLGVSIQGYMAMELIRKNNVELIKGVDRARTTTLYALKTAVVVAQALDNQRLVLEQIDALNTTTNNMIENTSVLLRQQTGRVHEQAVNSGVSVETLTKAFDNIFATLDEIETFKANANQSMAVTIDALSAQIDRAKPQLDRARQLEASANPTRQLGTGN